MLKTNKKYLQFVEVFHQDDKERKYTFLYQDNKPADVGLLVVCSTCYGRSVGTISAVDVMPKCLSYGLKGCSVAKPKDLLKEGWEFIYKEDCPNHSYWKFDSSISSDDDDEDEDDEFYNAKYRHVIINRLVNLSKNDREKIDIKEYLRYHLFNLNPAKFAEFMKYNSSDYNYEVPVEECLLQED